MYHRLSSLCMICGVGSGHRSSVVAVVLFLVLGHIKYLRCVMGKLNVTILRYLSKEDFRVLTAVGRNMINIIYVNFA
jgi:hypothetical protein